MSHSVSAVDTPMYISLQNEISHTLRFMHIAVLSVLVCGTGNFDNVCEVQCMSQKKFQQ